MILLLLLLLPAGLAAQALQGDYRYVRLSYPEGAAGVAKSEGGVVSFSGPNAVKWTETASYRAQITLSGRALDVRYNHDASLLISSAAEGGRHELFVAVRAAAEGAFQVRSLRGVYGAAFLALQGGKDAGLATGFAQLTHDGAGQFTKITVMGHAALVDDVNRRDEIPAMPVAMAANGTGAVEFGKASDVLRGAMNLAASADGAVLLGWSEQVGEPAILLAVRKNPDAAAIFLFRGRYFTSELSAENSFAFQRSTRLGSASGMLGSSLTGTAYISQYERVAGGAFSYLAAANRYRISSDGQGSLTARGTADNVDNFAFNEVAFCTAQAGAPGKLTLAHGVMFGIAVPQDLPVLTHAAAPQLPDAPIAPEARMVVIGGPSPLTVRVNGVAAAVGDAPGEFRAPAALAQGAVTVEVGQHRFLQPVIPAPFAAAPKVVDGSAIAVDLPNSVKVFFDGVPGQWGPIVNGQAKVIAPPGVVRGREVAVAFMTQDAFVDLADVTLPPQP
ncbi:MAG: hypothetical protein FJW31_07230 [Acidobacteria bacterium]|nr:hypothetical protein [Acidobacteriota bacterium]